MARRLTRCVECGIEVWSGEHGTVPKYCVDCRQLRQLAANRRYKERNPDVVAVCRVNDRQKGRERSRQRYVRKREEVRAYRRNLYETRQKATNAITMREYRRRNPGKQAEIEARRRARLLGAFVEKVDPQGVFDRDQGVCQLCGKAVGSGDRSLDHIVPLSRGGEHSLSNVQLAHRVCNSRKGNRLPAVKV